MTDTLYSSSSSSTYCNLKTNTNIQIITYTILHDLSLLCSIIISYPLYFSYFLFFSRYFIKLISPLFFTTVFLSLLLTTAFCSNLPQHELGILHIVINGLKNNLDEVHGDEKDLNFEDFDIYKIVFDRTLPVRNEGVEEVPLMTKKIVEHVVNGSDIAHRLCVENMLESSVYGGQRNDNAVNGSDIAHRLCVENMLESFVHDGLRNDITVNDPDKLGFEKAPEIAIHSGRIINVTITDSCVEKLLEEVDRFEEFTMVNETYANSDKVIGELRKADERDNDKQIQHSVGWSSWRSNSSSNFNSHGWMKEEKEWRRTLACMLFEERHNSLGGEEGMDSLWEDYETDNSKNQKDIMSNNNNGGVERFDDEEEDEHVDEEGEEMSSGHLCCLQALKLSSTRKVNMGMGRPNLVKITKALKGFGWLHQVKNKHGKRSLGSFMG